MGRITLWAALVLGLTIMWVQYGAATATTLLTIVSGAAAVAQAVAAWRLRSKLMEPSTPEQVDRAAEALAWEVRTQREAEADQRLLEDAGSLPIRWQARGGADAGDLAQLIASYADNPRRLVVIGEPGAGKTALCLLLTLELLRRPAPPQVPVLLQISSWDPSENLHAWLIRNILDDYPFLGNEARYGATAVRDLIAQHRILPVLDGLDEMAANDRATALRAIELDARNAEPVVLTCRSDEFHSANTTGIVRDALVVQLLPIAAETAADYLLEAAPDAGIDRWDPVLAKLTEGHDEPIVEALRTPLMLFLARTAYAHPDTDPAELLALPDARQIEERLLDVFTRHAFSTRPPSPLSRPVHPARRWDPAKAERWLVFLARSGGREIAWWRLHELVPKPVWPSAGALIGGASCTLLGWLFFGLFGRPGFGALLGLAVGVTCGLGLSFVRPENPRRFVPRPLRRRELARDLGFGVIGALVGGIIVGVLWGAGFGVVIGLVFGLAFGVVRRFTEPTESREAVTPARTLRDDELAVLYAAGLGAVVGVLVGALMGGVFGAADRGLIIPIDDPALVGLVGAAVGGLIGACGLGLVVLSTSACGAFLVVRLWLALRGRTPLRLMSFLADAHRLGVLRQVGPYYQFRHAVLQDRLAARP
ncbi:hypothetical protein AB0I53_13675 [Saccharopolyspora sp. NPDC050389]|uniref:hypothetical protein n=1 Tax=Saccharopolyspora sp. NPDC050389 TaxID=3155516 RepID=UPI0033D7E809